ncbi:hypothetical protein ACFFX0_00100 [Citricoccus parietis]|uniref:Uncharacterized protein n=1 Tax=Citricoccus parietis TaxID=592307 RepID=A0ABV5FSL9_9MICC
MRAPQGEFDVLSGGGHHQLDEGVGEDDPVRARDGRGLRGRVQAVHAHAARSGQDQAVERGG